MPSITERDIAYDMLFGSKTTAKLYCEASLESAHQNVYHLFRELEHHSHEAQHRIWEYLHRRSEYRVDEAHPREVEETRQRMERLAQDHFSQVGHGEYGRFQNTATGVPMGGVSSWTTTGTNYGTSTGFGTGTGAGTGTSSNYGSGESRYDWNRGESTRNLPEWVREPTRR